MDRVYLPQADLVRHGIGRHQLLAGGAALQETPAFRALMAEQGQRARQAYAEAFALLPPVDRRRQRPGLIMAAIYSALLDEIERSGYRVMTQRIGLTPLRKFWLACRTRASGKPPRIRTA